MNHLLEILLSWGYPIYIDYDYPNYTGYPTKVFSLDIFGLYTYGIISYYIIVYSFIFFYSII